VSDVSRKLERSWIGIDVAETYIAVAA
jgi:hypothetical protein